MQRRLCHDLQAHLLTFNSRRNNLLVLHFVEANVLRLFAILTVSTTSRPFLKCLAAHLFIEGSVVLLVLFLLILVHLLELPKIIFTMLFVFEFRQRNMILLVVACRLSCHRLPRRRQLTILQTFSYPHFLVVHLLSLLDAIRLRIVTYIRRDGVEVKLLDHWFHGRLCVLTSDLAHDLLRTLNRIHAAETIEAHLVTAVDTEANAKQTYARTASDE